MEGVSQQAPIVVPSAAMAQSSVRSTARTSGSALPEVQVSNDFQRLDLNADGESIDAGVTAAGEERRAGQF